MCKYCDVKPTNIAAKEYDNLTTIVKTRGNVRVVLEMYTYLGEKRIEIKFCPFCGRSLT